MMDAKEIKEKVNNFPTKYRDGFTGNEMKALAKELNVNEERFNEALGINTGIVVDGECLTFHCDVETALVCLSENREKNSSEWD